MNTRSNNKIQRDRKRQAIKGGNIGYIKTMIAAQEDQMKKRKRAEARKAK